MDLSTRTLTLLALTAVALSILSVIYAIANARRPAGGGRGLTGDEAVSALLARIERIEKAVRTLHGTDKKQQTQIEGSIRRVGLLRYDAFEDVGGRLSFSAALLDEHGTGMVITSINGRQETRVYAKPVTAGTSPYNLSLEEEEAINQAMAADRTAVAR